MKKTVLKKKSHKQQVVRPKRAVTCDAYKKRFGKTVQEADLTPATMNIKGENVFGVLADILPEGEWDVNDIEEEAAEMEEVIDDGETASREGQQEAERLQRGDRERAVDVSVPGKGRAAER